MANPQMYQDALATFNKWYNLKDFDLETLENNDKQFRVLDSYLSITSNPEDPAKQFVSWAVRTLAIYLNENTTPNEDGKYVSSLDPQQFLNDFESLAQAKYLSTLGNFDEPTRKHRAGARKEAIQNAFKEVANGFKQSLPTMWKDRLKAGTTKLETLQNLSDGAFNMMNNFNGDKAEMDGHLTNVVAAYEAMQQLRNSRKGFFGWFWKLFNRTQNNQEKEYLTALASQVGQLQGLGYNVSKVTQDLTGKTILGKEITTELKAPQKEVAQTQASPAKSSEKTMQIAPVSERLARKMQGFFLSELVAEWKENLPENIKLADITLKYAIGTNLINGIKQLNATFDKRVAENSDPKKEMECLVKEVFKLTVSHSSKHIANETGAEKAEALKVIAKTFIDAASPAALYPQELGSVVESALNQSVFQYKAIVKEGKDYFEEMKKYEVVDNTREQLFDDNHPFMESNVAGTSAQVSQQPKFNDLIK